MGATEQDMAMRSNVQRLIYLFVAVALSVPLILDVKLTPAQMTSADAFYLELDKLERKEGNLVLIAADWGPTTKAENQPQTATAIEHLMRKRIPFALISLIPLAEPFLRTLPKEIAERLERESSTGERWKYGVDWVNWGFQPDSVRMIEALAKASDISSHLKADSNGTPLEDLPVMKGVKDIRNISMLLEFTGSIGAFNAWLQFFQAKDYRPPILHGCTSVTIPEAFIYFSSGQIVGLHEGIAGAAWYEELLTKKYPGREIGEAIKINTGVSFAQLIILLFILLGNLSVFYHKIAKRKREKAV